MNTSASNLLTHHRQSEVSQCLVGEGFTSRNLRHDPRTQLAQAYLQERGKSHGMERQERSE